MKIEELEMDEVAGKIVGIMCRNSKTIARQVLIEMGLSVKDAKTLSDRIYGQIVDGGGDDDLHRCIMFGLDSEYDG